MVMKIEGLNFTAHKVHRREFISAKWAKYYICDVVGTCFLGNCLWINEFLHKILMSNMIFLDFHVCFTIF
jgi:hypothetical protein